MFAEIDVQLDLGAAGFAEIAVQLELGAAVFAEIDLQLDLGSAEIELHFDSTTEIGLQLDLLL